MAYPSHRHREPESRLGRLPRRGAHAPRRAAAAARRADLRRRCRRARLRGAPLVPPAGGRGGTGGACASVSPDGGPRPSLRCSASTSARPRRRRCSSVSTAGCSASGGRRSRRTSAPDGRAEQDPRTGGGRWRPRPARSRRSGPARRRSSRCAGWARARRSRSWTVPRTRSGRRSPGRTGGSAGAGSGCCPRIDWLARNDPDAAAEARWLATSWDALGLWLTGEAATTLQGHEQRACRGGPRGGGVRASQVPPGLGFGEPLGGLRAEAAARSGCPPGSRSSRASTTGPRACWVPACVSPGDAVDTGGTSGGIGIYADRAVEVPGLFVAPAPLPGRWVVGGAMAATGAAVDWLRGVDRRRLDDGGAVRRGVGGPAGRGRPPVPAVPGGRAGAALRRAGTRRVRRPDARARPRTPRAGGARGGGVRDARRRRADRRGRRTGPRPPARGPRQSRRPVGADQGGRARRARHDPGDRRDRRPRRGDPGRGGRRRGRVRSRRAWRR